MLVLIFFKYRTIYQMEKENFPNTYDFILPKTCLFVN